MLSGCEKDRICHLHALAEPCLGRALLEQIAINPKAVLMAGIGDAAHIGFYGVVQGGSERSQQGWGMVLLPASCGFMVIGLDCRQV